MNPEHVLSKEPEEEYGPTIQHYLRIALRKLFDQQMREIKAK